MLAVVLIALGIVSVLVIGWMRHSIERHKQAREAEWALQAESLAQSAIERAVARLVKAPEYVGETWKLSAHELFGSDAADVRIHVSPIDGQATRRLISVEAEFPANGPQHVRRSKQLLVEVPRS